VKRILLFLACFMLVEPVSALCRGEGETCSQNLYCCDATPYCWAEPNDDRSNMRCHAEPARKGYHCSGPPDSFDDDCEGYAFCVYVAPERNWRCSECDHNDHTNEGVLWDGYEVPDDRDKPMDDACITEGITCSCDFRHDFTNWPHKYGRW